MVNPWNWCLIFIQVNFFPFCSIQAVEDIKKQGRICILDVDVQGVKSIKKTNLNPRYIFISPPNLKELVSTSIYKFRCVFVHFAPIGWWASEYAHNQVVWKGGGHA